MSGSLFHEPVLCEEAVRLLVTDPSGIYVDGTLGGGGHAGRICERLTASGRLIALDADADAVRSASARLAVWGDRVTVVHANFVFLREVLLGEGIVRLDGVLLDLGVSSFQLDAPGKGFTFRTDAPLDMRFDRQAGRTAADVVNTCPEAELAGILSRYGEERRSRMIARSIVRRRPFYTTGALRDAVASVVDGPQRTKSLARVFQALRIEVNRELDHLERVLDEARALLVDGGRLVVISYHSLEDRMVKRFLRETEDVPPLLPVSPVMPFRPITRGAVVPSAAEVRRNPRSRSAKLRAAERVREHKT